MNSMTKAGERKLGRQIKKNRSRQDSNLRGHSPIDFESIALTTRPQLPSLDSNFLVKYFTFRKYEQKIFTDKSLSEALLFAEHGENMLCTKIGLSLEFSCLELVIQ